jgi:hypothetical protein
MNREAVMARETDLYAPVKDLLEGRGYDVKGEINGCDIVAHKTGEPTVVVELKLAFSLDLLLQGVTRLSLSDDVYLAVPAPDTAAKRRRWRGRRRGILKLCRMLGLGLILIDTARPTGRQATVLLDPAPYTPRKNRRRQTRLLQEFQARDGDPNTGGVSRRKIVTAYRQDALRCAAILADGSERRIAEITELAGVPKAASILQKNHYGWFDRSGRGIYRLAPSGYEGLQEYDNVVQSLVGTPGS